MQYGVRSLGKRGRFVHLLCKVWGVSCGYRWLHGEVKHGVGGVLRVHPGSFRSSWSLCGPSWGRCQSWEGQYERRPGMGDGANGCLGILSQGTGKQRQPQKSGGSGSRLEENAVTKPCPQLPLHWIPSVYPPDISGEGESLGALKYAGELVCSRRSWAGSPWTTSNWTCVQVASGSTPACSTTTTISIFHSDKTYITQSHLNY